MKKSNFQSSLSLVCVYIYIYIYILQNQNPPYHLLNIKSFCCLWFLSLKESLKIILYFNKCLRKYHSNEPLAEHQRGQSAKVSPKFLKIIYITMWCDYIYLQVALFENTTLPLNFLNVLILFTVSKLINKTQTN